MILWRQRRAGRVDQGVREGDDEGYGDGVGQWWAAEYVEGESFMDGADGCVSYTVAAEEFATVQCAVGHEQFLIYRSRVLPVSLFFLSCLGCFCYIGPAVWPIFRRLLPLDVWEHGYLKPR